MKETEEIPAYLYPGVSPEKLIDFDPTDLILLEFISYAFDDALDQLKQNKEKLRVKEKGFKVPNILEGRFLWEAEDGIGRSIDVEVSQDEKEMIVGVQAWKNEWVSETDCRQSWEIKKLATIPLKSVYAATLREALGNAFMEVSSWSTKHLVGEFSFNQTRPPTDNPRVTSYLRALNAETTRVNIG